MTAASVFPLSWPRAFKRTPAAERERGQFQTTLAKAIENVQTSLRRFSVDSGEELVGLVISSNVSLGVSNPEDAGVAVWFTWGGMQVCIPVDRYLRVEANLQAIHHIVEARRTELRHGTLALVRATFSGFKALPAPAGSMWWQVLGVKQGAPLSAIEAQYRKLRSETHPDKPGGDAARFDAVQKAYEQAQEATA